MDDRSAHRLQRRGSRSLYHDGGSLFSLVLALAAGRPVFNESEYTAVGGKVVDIFDLSDATRTHVLTQADPAKQVLVPVAHADFGGGLCYDFDGATTPYWYTSNRSASYWDFLLNGPSRVYTSMTVKASGAAQIMWETTVSGTGGASAQLSAANVIRWVLFRTGSTVFLGTTSAYTNNVPALSVIGVDAAASPQRYIDKTSNPVESTTLGGTDKTSDLPLTFGARSNNTLPLKARVQDILLCTPTLNAAQEATVAAYFAQPGRGGLAL